MIAARARVDVDVACPVPSAAAPGRSEDTMGLGVQVDLADVRWLSSVLEQRVVDSELDPTGLAKMNKTSAMRWSRVRFADGGTCSLVLKASVPGDTKAKMLGLAREGIFYECWPELGGVSSGNLLGSLLPKVYYAAADMDTGAKAILLEDLSSCVQAGYFFGEGNVNNWGRNLVVEKKGVVMSPSEVTRAAFSVAAKLHASHWNNPGLRGNGSLTWLRGSEWLDGKGRDSWEASQASVSRSWSAIKAKLVTGNSEVTFSPLLVACLDAAVAKISWDAYQAEVATRPWTLTHGDFHPGNFMVRDPDNFVLIDWELVGVGSGPQDLGQFMLSHAEPSVRAQIERGAVVAYHAEIVARNPAVAMTLEECWVEYVAGGLGRWLWFVPVLVDMCPSRMGQFFVDQVEAFMKDHNVTPETVPMPRA